MEDSKEVFKVPAPKAVQPPAAQEQLSKEKDVSIRSLALKAASTMVGQVSPAQLERAVTESAAYIYSLKTNEISQGQSEDANQSTTLLPIQLTNYKVPDWGGPPSSSLDPPYSLEILKSGQILDEITLDSEKKSFYSFGKLPDCDIVIEHPTCSRFHATLQFNNATNTCCVWDNCSTHGTFLNKKRIKPGIFVPVSVGDQIGFGMSSRKYLMGGPEELRPEEGLNRMQKKQLALLKIAEKSKEKDKMKSEVQMQAALKGEVTWGMKEDAFVDEGDTEDFDWRSYANAKGLTEKQEKIAQKIRSKEYKIQSLEKENKRIKIKSQKELGLTPGQAATLARNEQNMDRFLEEKEELEEILIDSIKDQIQGKKRKAEEEEEAAKQKKGKRRKVDSDEDDPMYDDDEDFYDRTNKKTKSKTPQKKVLSPETLYGEKAVLEEELKIIYQKLTSLETNQQQPTKNNPSNQFSRSKNQQQEQDKEEQEEASDQLDSYMHYIQQEIVSDNATKLQERQQKILSEISRLENLLKVTDPQQYYKPGSKIAEAAKAKAMKEKEVKMKKQQLEKKLQKEEDEKLKMQEFVDDGKDDRNQEIDKDEVQQKVETANVDGETVSSGGLEIRRTDSSESNQEKRSDKNNEQTSEENSQGWSRNNNNQEICVRQLPAHSASGLLTREQVAELVQRKPEKILRNNRRDIEQQLDEEMHLLSRVYDIEEAEENGAQKDWKPPEGQTGDGRQKLNDKLGY